jgi:hypothetical protein
MKKKSTYPPGWDEARVHRVLAHYEQQTEAEAVAEDEVALETTKVVTSLDVDLLSEIIAAVEEWADRQGLTLAPNKVAQLIVTLYCHFLEEGRKVDKKMVGRVCLKLVA